jgi:hypothetical protein
VGTIVTSLNENYQQKEWTVQDAVREIISNAIDGEVRHKGSGTGKMTIAYNAKSQNLIVTNEGVIVPTKALLMGVSESRAYTECIGKFGEGLLMALLVLARTNTPTYIENNDEKWEPEIVFNDDYKARVLVIHTRKLPKTRSHFSVRIGDVTSDQYKIYMSLFLRFDPRFKAEQVLSEQYGKKQILLQPEFRGAIYNMGVYVQSRADLLYGYNLDMNLNRDRNFVDEWNLKEALHGLLDDILRETVDQHPDAFNNLVALLLTSSESMETNHGYGNLSYNNQLGAAMERLFVETHGDAVPVGTQEESDEVEALGRTAVITTALVRSVLEKRGRSLAKLREDASKKPKRVYKLGELDPNDKVRLTQMLALLKPHFTKTGPLKVADLAEHCPMVFDKDTATILLNHSVLSSPGLLLQSLISGALQRENGYSNRADEAAILISLVLKGLNQNDAG